jgi:hypothetical protein
MGVIFFQICTYSHPFRSIVEIQSNDKVVPDLPETFPKEINEFIKKYLLFNFKTNSFLFY